MNWQSLDPNARELYTTSMDWMDQRWDQDAGLLREPADDDVDAPHHPVKESVWYAFGLLMRNSAGDVGRAVRVLNTVLNYQFDSPGRPLHGTFFRAPEEPYPPDDAIIWRDYDPNWREFIMTVLALALMEFADRLPPDLVARIDIALARAVAGAIARGLSSEYTNIALMHAFMLCFAGRRLDNAAWVDEGERMGRQVYTLFKQHDAFGEYNSPTYYGVDLYALALWRSYPAISPLLAQWGGKMEAALWRDLVRFYHPGLKNLAGPYDRSYGMDMRRYVSLVGMWMYLAAGRTNAPFPDTNAPFDHAHDFAFAPLFAFLGARVPADVTPSLLRFPGERQVERVISDAPRRIATAWLGQERMLGGEFTSRTRPRSTQLVPATIHWRIDAETVGWVRLLYAGPVDARATRDQLEITGTGMHIFEVMAPGAAADQIARSEWRLPALNVHVGTNARRFSVDEEGDRLSIEYSVDDDDPITCILTCS